MTPIKETFSRILSGATHELIGPVNQASSLIALFIHRAGSQTNEDGQRTLAHIESSTSRLQASVEGLRTWLRVVETEYEAGQVDMNEIARGALRRLRRDIHEAGAGITSEALPSVTGNAALMGELLCALLSNAIRFRRAGVPPEILISAMAGESRC